MRRLSRRVMFLYNRYFPRRNPKRRNEMIEEICALPGEKYKPHGISAEDHADYSAKYPEITGKLGLRIAKPEDIPIAEDPDPSATMGVSLIEAIEAGHKRKLKKRRKTAEADADAAGSGGKAQA